MIAPASTSGVPLKIGLTGGIGSGKTTIACIFEKLGYPVYISDSRASWLTNHNEKIRRELIRHFGEQIYTREGILNKKNMADLIFKDKSALAKVNSIVHPEVLDDFIEWSRQQHAPFILFESAILFESGLSQHFDLIINVTASQETRIRRIIKRDDTTPEKVMERINNQYSDEERCRKSDFIINTDDDRMLLQQVLDIAGQLTGKRK